MIMIKNKNNNNNNPVAQQPIKGQYLPTNCLPHVHLFAGRGERSSRQFKADV